MYRGKSNKRRGGEDGGDDGDRGGVGQGNHSVPFIDANLELGEVPLDDIDTFVVPARDEKGAYQTVHLNIPPHLFRQIQIVVKSGRYPYLDVSDFIRHGITRHLHFTVAIRESISNHVYTGTEVIMEVCRDNELRLRVAAAFEEIDRQITRHMDRLEIADAIRLLTILKNRVDVIPSSPRQFELRSGILRRFGYVLEHSNAVRPMTEEELKASRETGDQDGQPDGAVQKEQTGGREGTKRGGYQ
jgi:Arc/MetJ-type ribon-helix-helix transcriptional regulator